MGRGRRVVSDRTYATRVTRLWPFIFELLLDVLAREYKTIAEEE
jgi:hypothetical protein